MANRDDVFGAEPPPNVLIETARRARTAFGTIFLFSLVMNLLVLAAPIYMLQVYHRVLASNRVETLIMLTIMMAVAFAAMAALDALRTAITVRLGAWFTRSLGPYYIETGVRARLDGHSPGGQAFRDLDKIQSFVATQGMNALFDAPWTPIFIAIIWLLHPWLGMFAVASALILLLLSLANALLTRGPLNDLDELSRATTRTAEATIQNAEPVSAMGMTPALVDRWNRQNAETEAVIVRANLRGSVTGGFSKFFRNFLQSAVLGLGAYLVVLGEATAGTMIAASIMLGRALAPVDQAIGAWKGFESARHAYERLSNQAETYPPKQRRMKMPTPRGGLEVENLYVYLDGRLVVNGVSLEVAPGEAVAVIGPSAAGKSTLCRAIVGLAPIDDGVVRLDGVDMALWDKDELGPFVGYLPQDGGLFAGSVRENISRMREASDEAVIEAARLAHAHDMIARLPEGYETELGEGGLGLSGGQRQRLGLARAVFGTPPLIVLDEPNANLDQAGEAALAESILELKRRGSTLLIVGHRPSTIAQADKVLLLAEGEVQAFGPRNEVLERMREVARAQTEPGRDDEARPSAPSLAAEPEGGAAAGRPSGSLESAQR